MCLYTALPYTATLLHLHWFWSYTCHEWDFKRKSFMLRGVLPWLKGQQGRMDSNLINSRLHSSKETYKWYEVVGNPFMNSTVRRKLLWRSRTKTAGTFVKWDEHKKPESIRWAAEIASLLMGNVRSHLVLTRVERIFVSRFCSVHVKDRITPRPLRTQICKTEITLIIPE